MLYVFGQHTLDTRQRELLTADGPIPLRPKVYGLLAYLIENCDRVVPKQELFEQLWPDVHVGDATLNTCIKAARQAVGDDGQSQAIIQTKHGHGYRFVAPVEQRDLAAPDRGDLPSDAPSRSGSPPSPAPSGAPDSSASTVVSPAAFPTGKEHKQVTVLHCELLDASGLAARLGPEGMDDAMERFMAVADGTVERYGGTVIQWLGGGVVALFGAPRATEEHARRAVSASLDLLSLLAKDKDRLTVQIGLHTGPVVVGTLERDPGRIYTAAGETTETAEILQRNAPPSTVVVSEQTFVTVQSEVDAEPFTVDRSVPDGAPPAYLIRRLITRQAGVPRRSGRLLSRFVGRERELDILRDRLESLSEGSGRIVSVSGEPGIGKSRLIERFEKLAPDVPFYRANCLSYESNSPYLPIRRILRRLCDAKKTDTPEQILGKLRGCIEKTEAHVPTAMALLARLLELEVDSHLLEKLSPEEQRAHTFDHLWTVIACSCKTQPFVIVIEDLHWIDATSEAWLSGLVMRLAGVPVLVLVTYRPGYQPSWLQRTSATQLALYSLKSENSTALARSIPTAKPLSDSEVQRIVSKAQGNPFFLEELVWTLGSGQYDVSSIPETVHAVLAARIDRLASGDKRLLQIAAVIGAEVPFALLAAIDELADEERQQGLLHLQEAEFLYERQAAPERIFAFKHVLTQDVTYMSLVARTREAIHRRIANVLEAEFEPLVRERPELVAHHLTESGETPRAIDAWLRAGRSAVERSANDEAIAHLTRGLELVKALPDTAERTEREIALQLTLGVPLQSIVGPGAPDTLRAYRRASDLCRAGGDALSLFLATWGLWRFHSANTNMVDAREIAEDLLQLAQGHADPALLMQAHHAQWTTLYNYGELAAAEDHIGKGLALYSPREHGNQAFLVAGHDPGVCAHLTASEILWIKGYPDQALQKNLYALDLANDLGQPTSVAFALNHGLRLAVCRREPESVPRWQEPLRTLACEYGFKGHVAFCDIVQVWLEAQRGGTAARIAERHRTLLSGPDLAGAERPLARSILVQACGMAGLAAEGLDMLNERYGDADAKAQRFWDAELHRLRGVLLLSLSPDNTAEAESNFKRGIATARAQDAKSLELRSAVSLARLWDKQGKRAEARDLLAPIYAWFTEGHDTPDVIEARNLLAELPH